MTLVTMVNNDEPVVIAMTRPTMIGGFTLASLVLSFYVPGMLAMIVHAVWPLIFVPCLLLVSYLVCLKDVYLFDIAASAMYLRNCPNKRMWGNRRYAPR